MKGVVRYADKAHVSHGICLHACTGPTAKHLGILIGRSVSGKVPDISPYFLRNNPGPLVHNPRKVLGLVDLKGGFDGYFPVCVPVVAGAWDLHRGVRIGFKAARLTEAREAPYCKEMFWYRNGIQFLHQIEMFP